MAGFMGADLGAMLSTVSDGMKGAFQPRGDVPPGLANLAFDRRSEPATRTQYGGGGDIWSGLNYGGQSGVWSTLRYGGEATWDRLSYDSGVGPGLSGIDALIAKKQGRQAIENATGTVGQGQKVTERSPGGTGGSYDSGEGDKFEQYRALITKYAQARKIDPDALAAMLWIETDGDPTATSHAGARGLGQIMPETWAGLADPGDDPYNAEHSIKNAAKYFADLYWQYGSYELAAAAYIGGPNGVVNGKPRAGNFDGPGGVGGMDSAAYAERWQQNYNNIRSTAPVKPGSASMAGMFGNAPVSLMQGYGHTDFSTGEGESVYDFGTEFGLDGDEHSGWDIGVARGTQFAMPQGMSGKVLIAGGSDAYKTNSGNDPGQGELRILLDNGMILILGHNDRIDVKVGDRVTGGQLLGLTGSSGGDHLHLELRQQDKSTRSGWRIIDPATVFGSYNDKGGSGGNKY